MKTFTKTQLIQAGFNKTVLKRRTKLLTTLLAIIGLLNLILIASSNYLKYHMYRLGFESILRIKDNIVEKVLEKEQGFNLATTESIPYDMEIHVPQGIIDVSMPTFLYASDRNFALEVSALSGKAGLKYLTYNPRYEGILNPIPYTFQILIKPFWLEDEKIPSCLLITKGVPGMPASIRPEQNPNNCEVIWVQPEFYDEKHFIWVSAFSKGWATVLFTKRNLRQE